ncbi:MAG: pyridoxal 5'-phosphate synthase glutaminase subunit PdxT [Actinobacteria bacterium]|nr:pyridoxal 5'-phosphate synthase glutaminase subunit PdxT [Actinomycetota bacterium]
MTVRAGVLALQGDFREHAAALSAAGATPVLVRTAADLDGLAALVVPGGESTTMGALAERFGLVAPLREAIGGGLPTLGTCAGLIFLARATTGPRPQVQLGVLDAVVERNAFGRQVDSFETDLRVAGWAEPLRAVFIRAPRVERTGEGVEVLAAMDGHPVMVRQDKVLGTAFHPELTGDRRVHTLLLEMAGER